MDLKALVVDDEQLAREELCFLLAQVGGASKLVFKPLPSDDPRQRHPDISLARERLGGWEPKVGLDDGLRETIAYFRQLLAA